MKARCGLGQDHMERGSEPGLDKHVEAKHHTVRPSDRGRQDDRAPFEFVGQKAAEDETEGENRIAEDIVLKVDGSKDDGDDDKHAVGACEDDADVPKIKRDERADETDNEPHSKIDVGGLVVAGTDVDN